MVAFTGDGAQTARREARQMQQHLDAMGKLGDDQLQSELSSFKQASHARLDYAPLWLAYEHQHLLRAARFAAIPQSILAA